MIKNLDFITSPSTALHNQNSFWIPELNLIVYNMIDIVKDCNDNDVAFAETVKSHENFHVVQGDTGTIFNRMGWTENAMNKLMDDHNIENVIRSQIAIDKLHEESIALIEAHVSFQIHVQSTLLSEDNSDPFIEKMIDYLNRNNDANLRKDKKVQDIFNKLQEIEDWTKSWSFAHLVAKYALHLPYVLPEEQILSDNPAISPNNRFYDTYEVLKQLHNKKSLVNRSKFAQFVEVENNTTEGGFYSLLNEHTGFLFGPLFCSEDRFHAYHSVQNPKKYFEKKSDKERIQKHEELIVRNLGDVFLNFHETMFDENCAYVAYCNNRTTFYVPNYFYDDYLVDFAWQHMFLQWSLKESIIMKTDKESILELIDYFLKDSEMGINFKNNIKNIFEDIDYSKINPVLLEYFKDTSNKVGRKLNWE